MFLALDKAAFGISFLFYLFFDPAVALAFLMPLQSDGLLTGKDEIGATELGLHHLHLDSFDLHPINDIRRVVSIRNIISKQRQKGSMTIVIQYQLELI